MSIREQPHLPYVVVVADFAQLQPLSGGGSCWYHCQEMTSVQLETVYRSSDKEHLQFLERIRGRQPSRADLVEYYGTRHWKGYTLRECVAYGMELEVLKGKPFVWLCATNRGATEVCEEALSLHGISRADLGWGYLCDPTAKSELRIVAKPGVYVRLTRNNDKVRGFVNGAVGRIEESLHGNAVFTVRLVGSGVLVLVSPMAEGGSVFLPCVYGWATTIRRAQGASIAHGVVYSNQKFYAAPRGYGYVAVSRFRTRDGVYAYGKLRRTDYLPVREPAEDELLYRSELSESDASSVASTAELEDAKVWSECCSEASDDSDSIWTKACLGAGDPAVYECENDEI